MPEQNNDRLEQFFRKAATKADVPFNEDDWKKLEERLDAADAHNSVVKKTGSKITLTVVGTILLFSTAIWVNSRFDFISLPESEVAIQGSPEPTAPDMSEESARETPGGNNEETKHTAEFQKPSLRTDRVTEKETSSIKDPDAVLSDADRQQPRERDNGSILAGNDAARRNIPGGRKEAGAIVVSETPLKSQDNAHDLTEIQLPEDLSGYEADGKLAASGAVISERDKQRAVDELPGAEEGQTREAEAMVEEEHASDQKKHVATPRLSLLLFFAPDFSGTSMAFYSAPGKAFGGMLHYHLLNRWSISGGIVKNYKVYTGEGEDYKPPKGYWKSYTNGIIPETIDGSCSILEFPLMVQYTLANSGKNKWTVGAGMSSYLMQKESYEYNFDQPNPGAKQRWDSKRSSKVMFNMLNFTIGYERQIIPGLMLGLEPYAKIPLEEIGWSNLKLFSTGASFTLRYTLIGKSNPSLATRGRGPD
jgi:hypothetical protein